MVCDTDDAGRYRYRDGWEEMETLRESIPVKGHPDQVVTLRFTRHGPVVQEAAGKAYSVRNVWTEPGGAPYLASLGVMRARDWDSYRHALKGWGTPSLNHLYADTAGTIGWQTVGTAPIRPNWNGLVPMPGDGRYEWQGQLTLDQLPHAVNPARGFLATANENNIPEGWDPIAQEMIGYEWSDASRAERIHAVLDADTAHSLEAAGRLQNDVWSASAARMVAVLAQARIGAAGEAAAGILRDWDCVLTADSAPGLLHEVWMTSHLKPALFRAVGNPDQPLGLLAPGSVQSVLDILETPADWLDAPDPVAARDAILTDSLAAAWSAVSDDFGSDPAGWQWGKRHQLPLPHKLSRVAAEAAAWSGPTLDVPGSGSTPNNAVYRAGDFQTLVGPSVRLLMDVGAWDNSLCINLPGQSGDPASPHYTDLAGKWLTGGYVPLLYSDAAVEAATERRFDLTPDT